MLRMILLLTALLTAGLASTAVASPNTRNARSNANLERVDGTMMLIIRTRRGGTEATNTKGTTAGGFHGLRSVSRAERTSVRPAEVGESVWGAVQQ